MFSALIQIVASSITKIHGMYVLHKYKRDLQGLYPLVQNKKQKHALQGLIPLVAKNHKIDRLQGLIPLVAINHKKLDCLQGLIPRLLKSEKSNCLQGQCQMVKNKEVIEHMHIDILENTQQVEPYFIRGYINISKLAGLSANHTEH